jgi:formylglycine-generating enzyme required for sulfatase activity
VILGVALIAVVVVVDRGPLSAAPTEEDVDLTLSRANTGFSNSVGMRFVRVKAGAFLMGAPKGEKDADPNDEFPQHEVELTKDYYLGVHEVTQGQWKKVMGSNPSYYSKEGGGRNQVQGQNTDDFPVETVSYNDIQAFLKKLNDLPAEKAAGRTYRLPTEAEWEYAARGGGHREPFCLKKPSNSLSSTQANFNGNFPYGGAAKGPHLNRPTKVGSYEPNLLGVCDLHGNVWEWCHDWSDTKYYSKSPRRDPPGPATGSSRVVRGGSFNYEAHYLRAANRSSNSPTDRLNFIGFRAAATVR